MDNFVGKRLDGRYEIQEVIGVGGMAVVYKAYDNIDDRIVAVKVLKDELLENEEFRRKFKNESKAIAVLNHPNIVKVYDVSFGDKIQYIVMEYINGITLKEYISTQGIINWKEAVHFEMQILKALQHAHDKGIIHRDIKPQNIVLLQNGNIKVTDFGIARFARSDTRTMTEGAIGSVHYMSPEQAKGDLTDEKADIYSAGVVLYEMITGQVPFQGESAVSIAIMQLQREAKTPRSINPSIPIGLEQITLRSMQKNPFERYQSASEMLMDLNELVINPNISFEYVYIPSKYEQTPAKNPYEDTIIKDLEHDNQLEADELSGAKSNEAFDDEYYKNKYGKPEKDEDKAKKTKIIVGSVCGAVALIALIIVLALTVFAKIEVPNFVGLNYQNDIVDNEKYKDFNFNDVIYTTDFDSEKFKEGDVIRQDPPKGTKIKKSGKITLYVASATDGVELPDVSNKTENEARIILKEKGLENIKFEEKGSTSVKKEYVIETNPAAGTKVQLSTEIIVYVSAGNSFDMTDLVGMTKSDALKWLNEYKDKFDISVTFESKDSEKPKDTVIDQSISEGSTVKFGDTITVTLSNGNAPTTEPTTESTTAPVVTDAPSSGTKTINMTVTLPNTGNNETINIYVDGVLANSYQADCDGSAKTFAVTGKGTDAVVSFRIGNNEFYADVKNFDIQGD